MKKTLISLLALMTFVIFAKANTNINSSINSNISTVNIGEYDLAYEIAGQGKHIILLEAGMGQDLSTWQPIFDDLTKIAKVIRYSRVGLGNSTTISRQLSVENSVSHLDKLLTSLKIDSPVILVSHSFGGIISRKFAATYPKRVKAMLLLDPSSEHDLNIMRTIDLPQAMKEISIMKTMGIENGLDNSFLEYWSKRPMPNYPEIKDMPVVVIASVRKWENPPMLLLTDKGRELMGEWHKTWAEQFPKGRAVITTISGHNIHFDEPQLVLKEVNSLIKTLD